MYSNYWKTVWKKEDVDIYRKYINKYNHLEACYIDLFKRNKVKNVCDAACGFGANALVLCSNGFNVTGFDIAEDSIEITKLLLNEFGYQACLKETSILNTGYSSHSFDAVTARAVMDHLTTKDMLNALDELKRIVKEKGFLYFSFDAIEDDDITCSHDVLEDGSFVYKCPGREGLLFHYYSDNALLEIFKKENVVLFLRDNKGNRHIVIEVK